MFASGVSGSGFAHHRLWGDQTVIVNSSLAQEARDHDRDDPAEFRNRFMLQGWSGGEVAYFAGNSLGLQPVAAAGAVTQILSSWASLGVNGHFTGDRPWSEIAESTARSMCHVVGALPNEVILMNTLTVNLHLLMAAFYRPTATRFKIVIESGAFPSDDYAAASHVSLHGLDPQAAILRVGPRAGEHLIDIEDLIAAIDESVALIVLPGINFRTGQVLDIPALTAAAHNMGAVAIWDLAHSAGNVEMQLHDWGVDAAAWCTYKYLNSGPGAVAGAFIHERHVDRTDVTRLSGWWGNKPSTRFAMTPEIEFAAGASGWQISNPPILSLAPIQTSLDIVAEAGGMASLRKRSLRLTNYLEGLIDRVLAEFDVKIITPRNPEHRGAQLSLLVPNAVAVTDRLFREFGVLPDERPPNIIRFAPCPLYSTYFECFRAVDALRQVLADR